MNFSSLNIYEVVLLNITLMIFWHLLVLMVCRVLPNSFFDSSHFMYKARDWERGGKFYVKWLKIKKWKDHLPQYVARGGFSKRSLDPSRKMDKKYVETFITEICRAEWNHFVCSCYFVISFLINTRLFAIVFSLIPIVANFPFLIIQRYNRLRFMRLYKKI